MSKRLVRVKNKIRAAAIPFRIPDPPERAERVSFVLDAIYSAYTTGWDSLNEAESTHLSLAAEAISLGRMLVELMPGEPEARGLLAMMLHCESRQAARFAPGSSSMIWARPRLETPRIPRRPLTGRLNEANHESRAAGSSMTREFTVCGASSNYAPPAA